MFRRIFAWVFVVAIAGTVALAQPAPLLLASTPVWRTAFLSLDAVQAQVDATLRHAAASKHSIALALAAPSPALLPSTPIARR